MRALSSEVEAIIYETTLRTQGAITQLSVDWGRAETEGTIDIAVVKENGAVTTFTDYVNYDPYDDPYDDDRELLEDGYSNVRLLVGIVLVILTLFMGWRMGIIIGSSLILTVLAEQGVEGAVVPGLERRNALLQQIEQGLERDGPGAWVRISRRRWRFLLGRDRLLPVYLTTNRGMLRKAGRRNQLSRSQQQKSCPDKILGIGHRNLAVAMSILPLHQPRLRDDGAPAARVAPLFDAHPVAPGDVRGAFEADDEVAVAGGRGRDVEGEEVAHLEG